MRACGSCGTQAIAQELTVCPHCGKELAVAKITSSGANVHVEDEPVEVSDSDQAAADETEHVEAEPRRKGTRG